MNTPVRTLRVEDELWEAAKAVAAAKGQTLPDEIRRFLRRYVNQAKRKEQQ